MIVLGKTKAVQMGLLIGVSLAKQYIWRKQKSIALLTTGSIIRQTANITYLKPLNGKSHIQRKGANIAVKHTKNGAKRIQIRFERLTEENEQPARDGLVMLSRGRLENHSRKASRIKDIGKIWLVSQ